MARGHPVSPGRQPGISHSGAPRWLERWWRGRYARMAENLPDRRPLGHEGDDLYLAAATLRAQQEQHLVDAGQQQRQDIARRFAMRQFSRVCGRPVRLGGCIRVGGCDTRHLLRAAPTQ